MDRILLVTLLSVSVVGAWAGWLSHLGVAASAVIAGEVLAALMMWRRGKAHHRERGVWWRWSVAALAIAVAAVLLQIGAAGLGAVVVSAVFPMAYGAIVRWNRYATNMVDPHEVLNGFASVAAVMAASDLVAQLSGAAPASLPTMNRVFLLAPAACAFIIMLSLLTVVPVAGLIGDPRAWLMLTSTVLAAIAGWTPVLGWSQEIALTALAGVALTGGWAAYLRPWTGPVRPANATDSTIGGFIIMSSALVILLTAALFDLHGPVLWCAMAAGVGASVRLLRNVRDIAALSTSRKEALTDELTGAANRRALLRHAEQLLGQDGPFALAMVDLDGFKRINDGLGHAAGDHMLRQTVARLRAVLSDTELLGRLGGDEFAVLSPLPVDRLTAHDAMADLGHRLSAAFTTPLLVHGTVLHTTGSIGVTAVLADQPRPELSELLRRADAAMYDAKTTRAPVVNYDPVRHADHGHLQLLEQFREALEADQLEVHYQPQIDIATGHLAGVEALVRWRHPIRGLLPPGEFVALAEAHGLMCQLTEHVIRHTAHDITSWAQQGVIIPVSVNLSASSLLDASFPRRLRTLLDEHGVPTSALVLEVTETVLVEDSAGTAAVLTALADQGFEISIDDFGTGWSSLAYLHRLPVRELKLDAAFTRNLRTDTKTAAIVSATIDLAHRIGLRTVAEGVEDEPTYLALRALGCDLSQGYWHAIPMPAAELTEWIFIHAAAAEVVATPL